MEKYYQFQQLLQQAGWQHNVFIGVDGKGMITYLSAAKPAEHDMDIELVKGAAIPGFVNAHSHSFQYAMAGQAEIHVRGTEDDFWSWREAMYSCALRMNPDDIEKVTTLLYKRLVKNGYTTVVEFHYLHHDKDGQPYSHIAETGARIIAAAEQAGIKLVLVPVYYQTGDFGSPAQYQQRRFISNNTDAYLSLLEASEQLVKQFENVSLGYGPHSLRAVPSQDILALFNIVHNKNLPFHIHLSEQLKEVERCIAYLGKRPVEWILDSLPVSDRFNFVHCTHLQEHELKRLAQSKANVILCPSTEGNLGDGIFPLADFKNETGNWAIGTDSQIQLNPLEDIRWLDYAQRLTRHRRNTFDNGAAAMIEQLFFSGHKAAGNSYSQYFATGQPLDAVVYNLNNPVLERASADNLLPAIVYTSGNDSIAGTIINGNWKYKRSNHDSI